MVKFAILGIGSGALGFTKGEWTRWIKGGGGVVQILIETPKSSESPFLWAWLEMFFIAKKYPILKQHLISCHLFSAEHPKRYRLNPRWETWFRGWTP